MQISPYFGIYSIEQVRTLMLAVTSNNAVQNYQDFTYGYPFDYPWYLSAVDEGCTLINKGLYNDDQTSFLSGCDLLAYICS